MRHRLPFQLKTAAAVSVMLLLASCNSALAAPEKKGARETKAAQAAPASTRRQLTARTALPPDRSKELAAVQKQLAAIDRRERMRRLARPDPGAQFLARQWKKNSRRSAIRLD